MDREKEKRAGGKLRLWQERLHDSDAEYGAQVEQMDRRERLYRGDNKLRPLVPGDTGEDGHPRRTSHVRNIVFENIESQVSSSVPMPKVTPRRKKDEHLAEIIEHFLRNELDRLPFETMNDMAERTVPIQGGVAYLVEWDNAQRTSDTVGECVVKLIHPKQLAPQPGVTEIQDMDWIILKIPTTLEAIRREYGVAIREGEEEPEIRGVEGVTTHEDLVTKYIGYARNDRGSIDRYVWANDTELEDLENYQARRQPVCRRCGRVRPLPGQVIRGDVPADGSEEREGEELARQILAGHMLASQLSQEFMDPQGVGALEAMPVEAQRPETREYDGGPCPWCGCQEFDSREEEYEEISIPIRTKEGTEIPGATPDVDMTTGLPVMRPTVAAFYRPDRFPLVLQRSVSVYGQLLGNSDVDTIADQQNTVNRLEQKIIDRLMQAGTRVSLPADATLEMSPRDGLVWRLQNAADKAMIGTYEFKGDLEYELLYLANAYEEARQLLGITDSFQGRADTTATSGKAKEFSAAQAAGRLESKRTMKNAAYADLFRMMFQFWLAYSDEPRQVSYKNSRGETEYQEFNRYDFLERGDDGELHWNDQFLFSCDTSATLAGNREAMWQETRQNLQTGAFGDPASTETLVLFWAKMQELHYPGAGQTKTYLEEKLRREQAQQAAMQQAAVQQQAAAMAQAGGSAQRQGAGAQMLAQTG